MPYCRVSPLPLMFVCLFTTPPPSGAAPAAPIPMACPTPPTHVANHFASYIEIPRHFPWGFFPIAGDSGCVSELLLPKRGEQIPCENDRSGFIRCARSEFFLGNIGARRLHNP